MKVYIIKIKEEKIKINNKRFIRQRRKLSEEIKKEYEKKIIRE